MPAASFFSNRQPLRDRQTPCREGQDARHVCERPESPDEQGQGDGQEKDDEEETDSAFYHKFIIPAARHTL
jgi:hypothetical protein